MALGDDASPGISAGIVIHNAPITTEPVQVNSQTPYREKAGNSLNEVIPWGFASAIVVLAVHASFAAFSGPFQDGWLHSMLFERQAYREIFDLFMNNGRPVAAWFNLGAMRLSGGANGAIWLAVLAAAAAALGWFMVFIRTGLISPMLAFVMASVATLTPAHQIILVSPAVVFISAHAFFSIGLWLLMESRLLASRPARNCAYFFSCICAVFAATLGESLAITLLVYPLVLLLIKPASMQKKRELIHSFIPVVLGCSAFFLMFFMFPAHGAAMITERRLTFQPLQLALSSATFAVTICVAYLPFWAVVAWAGSRQKRHSDVAGPQNKTRLLWILAILTAILSLAPYIVALRLASPSGWGLRYLYYFGSSLSWMMAAIALGRDPSSRRTLSRRYAFALTAAVAIGLLVRWPFFAVRVVHEDIVSASLRDNSLTQKADILVFDDRTEVIAAPIRDWEWTGLAQRALGRPLAVAGIAFPQEPESVWSKTRLKLRQTMGWSNAEDRSLTPQYLQEHLRELTSVPALVTLGGCRIVQVTVAQSDPHWYFSAMSWFFASLFQPASYRQLVLAQSRNIVSVTELSPAVRVCN